MSKPQTNNPVPPPLTEQELAERWPISIPTLRRWRRLKKGPSYAKLGRRVVYPLAAVEQYEKDHTIKK